MNVVEVTKEFTDEDVRRYKKLRKKVPGWLFGRPAGTKLRCNDKDLQEHKEFLSEIKEKRSRKRSEVSESNDV